MFGRDPSTPLSLLFGDPPTTGASTDETSLLAHYRQAVNKAHQFARDNMATMVERRRRQYCG